MKTILEPGHVYLIKRGPHIFENCVFIKYLGEIKYQLCFSKTCLFYWNKKLLIRTIRISNITNEVEDEFQEIIKII